MSGEKKGSKGRSQNERTKHSFAFSCCACVFLYLEYMIVNPCCLNLQSVRCTVRYLVPCSVDSSTRFPREILSTDGSPVVTTSMWYRCTCTEHLPTVMSCVHVTRANLLARRWILKQQTLPGTGTLLRIKSSLESYLVYLLLVPGTTAYISNLVQKAGPAPATRN